MKTSDFLEIYKDKIKSYAEVGVGYGGNLEKVVDILNENTEIYLFDFDHRINTTVGKIENKCKEKNITIHKHINTELYRDSYNWSLMKLLEESKDEKIFDYVYIGGAHDWTLDGFCFFLVDGLLRDLGFIEFDDYDWFHPMEDYNCGINIIGSGLYPQTYTMEHMSVSHITKVIDLLVKTDDRYIEIHKNRLFQKVKELEKWKIIS